MTDHLPLAHRRIVVTRSPDQAEAMCAQLAALGATAVRFPAIDFIPLPAPELDTALAHVQTYDWLLFTSGNAVRFFFDRLAQTPAYHFVTDGSTLRIAAVGSATQQLLAEKQITVDFVPDVFTGEQLALGLADVAGQRILLPRASQGRPEIVDILRRRGAVVDDIPLYATVTAVPTPDALAELEKGVDMLTFTSPSSVRNFWQIVSSGIVRFAKPGEPVRIAVIGPATAAEAEKVNLPVDIMPEAYTIEGLVTAVADYFQRP